MTPVLDHIDILTRPYRPGPSPIYVCSRPSCGLAYRLLTSTPDTPPACPKCAQPWIPCHGTRIDRLVKQAERVMR